MANVRLSYSTTNIDFGAGPGFVQPKIPDRANHRTGDGTLYSYDFYTPKKRWEVPITDMGKTDADNINSWWENNYTCTFYPDYTNDPGTSYSVKIVNKEQPLQYIFPHWDEHFQGKLILEEV